MHVLSALLEQHTGQQIAPNRTWRIETALKPVLRDRGLASLDELVAAMLRDQSGQIAAQAVDALLNQETSFYRDAGVIETVAGAVEALAATLNRRVSIWSAACSTGQEPLSLAMLFAERSQKAPWLEPEILATDVSETALGRARAGRYSQFEIQRGLPIRKMVDWFSAEDTDWVARPELVRRICFRRHNLVSDPPPIGRFDIILCRNVLLYLSPELRRRVFERLASAIRPGGLLVLGAGETVIGQSEAFVPSATYRGFYEPAPPARTANAA
ncbi:protein-glutamate O-methyltransferase CheR [Sphingomonas sp.]|uniref:CheR family methyltransferase n=1 Tax=Sphingomonas sp. TaxID=28214 RepID=UPI001D817960|nr:protein-glutamate O-methyltransferase CheR [Sphingomonas sp.]MBX9796360.1 protein-glutamate O-methyltransferase CheR [Sphingomonas sp.]